MYVEQLIARVERLINRGDARMCDLAQFLGKNWNQCHEWIVKKNHKPSAEVALGMAAFVAMNDQTSKEVEMQGSDLIINGRKTTNQEKDLWMENSTLRTMVSTALK